MADLMLRMPSLKTFDARIEWAGERLWDLAEGTLDKEDSKFVWATIVGWADLCTEDERRQYHELAKSFSTLMQTVFEQEGG